MKNLFILFLIPFVCSCKKATKDIIGPLNINYTVILLYKDKNGNDLLDQSKANAYKKEDLYYGINKNGKLTPIQTDIYKYDGLYDSLLINQYHQIRLYIDSGVSYLHLNANTIDTFKCEFIENKSANGTVISSVKKKIWHNNKLVWDVNTSKGSDLIKIIK